LDVGASAKCRRKFEQLTRRALDEAATMKEGSPRRAVDFQGEVDTRNYG